MGPNYRIAILINGEWAWLQSGSEIYIAYSREQAEQRALAQKNRTVVVSAWGSTHKLPENPKYTAIIY